MKSITCPVCGRQMEHINHVSELAHPLDKYTEENDYYHCYNHDGGAVFLSVTWREYDKEELRTDY